MPNPILTEVISTFPERQAEENAGHCDDDAPWDIVDQAWAWRESIKEPEALEQWSAADIEQAIAVLTWVIDLDPTGG